jgi:hypothetical protein
MRTVPWAIHLFLTDYGVEWGSITAGGILRSKFATTTETRGK